MDTERVANIKQSVSITYYMIRTNKDQTYKLVSFCYHELISDKANFFKRLINNIHIHIVHIHQQFIFMRFKIISSVVYIMNNNKI